jgi:hypothetical protein
LVSLSKALAEHRRVNTAQLQVERRFPGKERDGEFREGDLLAPLPAHTVRIIAQIYGVDIEAAWGRPRADGGEDHPLARPDRRREPTLLPGLTDV